MLDLPDPVSDLLGVFFKRALNSKIMQYATLVLEMAIASTIAGLVACGVPLVAGKAPAFAIGCGMVAAGVAIFCTFQASKNSKGLIISLPDDAAAEKLDTHVVTIERK